MTSPLHNPAMDYRKDIDGLRAVAVLGVLLYHFGLGGISGGFVGVDVFFVISGYLITTIIQREIEKGQFSFLRFYERRVRRIFPALFAVLIATVLVGLYVMLPSDLVILGKGLIATLAFGSNLYFWRNSGYFDPDSKDNPLLHTWSLSVEEQFYIFLPLLLILIHRFLRGKLSFVLLSIAAISLAVCIVLQSKMPVASFYLLPFRAWELLIGSYLAVARIPQLKSRKAREWVSWAAVVLLALGYAFITEGYSFPGWYALVPTVATALLLHSGASGDSSVKTILSLKPLVFVGLISYSLYLWHWPVVVYAKYIGVLEAGGSVQWLLIMLSIILAVASYNLVEKPVRIQKEIFTGQRVAVFSVFVIMALSTFSYSILKSNGLNQWYPSRIPKEVVAADKDRRADIPFHECNGVGIKHGKVNQSCLLGDLNVNPTIVVWGDSHSMAWSSALNVLFKKNHMSGVLLSHISCPPLYRSNWNFKPGCKQANRLAVEYILNNQDIRFVILSSKWAAHEGEQDFEKARTYDDNGNLIEFKDAFNATLKWLHESDKRTWLIGPAPYPPEDLINKFIDAKIRGIPYAPSRSVQNAAMERDLSFKKMLNRNYIDWYSSPADWICPEGECSFIRDEVVLYRDAHHLSERGSYALLPYLEQDFVAFMAEAKADEDQ